MTSAPISKETALRMASKFCPPRPFADEDQESRAARLVTAALRAGHTTYRTISSATGLQPSHVNLTLTRLRKRGKVMVVAGRTGGSPTVWGIPETKA